MLTSSNFILSPLPEGAPNAVYEILKIALEKRRTIHTIYQKTINGGEIDLTPEVAHILNLKKGRIRKKSPETVLLNLYEKTYNEIAPVISNEIPFNTWFISFAKYASGGSDLTNRFDCCLKMSMLARLNSLKKDGVDNKILNVLKYFLSRFVYDIDEKIIPGYIQFCKYIEHMLMEDCTFLDEETKKEFRTINCFLALLYEQELFEKTIENHQQAGVITFLFQNSRFPCPTRFSTIEETKKNMTSFIDLNRDVLNVFTDTFKKYPQINIHIGNQSNGIYCELNKINSNLQNIRLMLTDLNLAGIDQFVEMISLISLTKNAVKLLANPFRIHISDFKELFLRNSDIKNIKKDISRYHKNVSTEDCLRSMMLTLEGFTLIESFYYLLLDSFLKQKSKKIDNLSINKFLINSYELINKITTIGVPFFQKDYLFGLKNFKKEKVNLRNALTFYIEIESIAFFSSYLINDKLKTLKDEKDLDVIQRLKESLNILTDIHDACVSQLSDFHNLIDIKHDDENINELHSQDLPIESEKATPESTLPLPNLEKVEEAKLEKKLEKPKTSVKQRIKNKQKTNFKNKNPKDLHVVKSTIPTPINVESSEPTTKEFGWDSHKKKRNLFAYLKAEGWKLDPTCGKGSHCKATGPNETVIFIPNQEIIKLGTFKSIEKSIALDKKN